MSALKGDRARYRINQVRKLHRRQRLQALVAGLKIRAAEVRTTAVAPTDGASAAAALAMQSEGGPTRSGD